MRHCKCVSVGKALLNVGVKLCCLNRLQVFQNHMLFSLLSKLSLLQSSCVEARERRFCHSGQVLKGNCAAVRHSRPKL